MKNMHAWLAVVIVFCLTACQTSKSFEADEIQPVQEPAHAEEEPTGIEDDLNAADELSGQLEIELDMDLDSLEDW